MTHPGVGDAKIKMNARDQGATGTGDEGSRAGAGGRASKMVSSEPSLKHRSIATKETAPEVANLHPHSAGWAGSDQTVGDPPL